MFKKIFLVLLLVHGVSFGGRQSVGHRPGLPPRLASVLAGTALVGMASINVAPPAGLAYVAYKEWTKPLPLLFDARWTQEFPDGTSYGGEAVINGRSTAHVGIADDLNIVFVGAKNDREIKPQNVTLDRLSFTLNRKVEQLFLQAIKKGEVSITVQGVQVNTADFDELNQTQNDSVPVRVSGILRVRYVPAFEEPQTEVVDRGIGRIVKRIYPPKDQDPCEFEVRFAGSGRLSLEN